MRRLLFYIFFCLYCMLMFFFFFSSRRRHTRLVSDWSSDVCSSDLGRSEAGYRLYSDADLARLAQVVFYRELGFSLQDIAVILDDPTTDVAVHLRRQREVLREHVERLEAKAAAITRALEAVAMNEPLDQEQAREIFGWSPSRELAQRQRTRTGRPDDWNPLATKSRAELQAIEVHRADTAHRLLAAFESGVGTNSPQAMDLAEEHLQDLRSVFECTYE